MPRLRTHCAVVTGAPTIDIAVDGSWYLRRLVHHMASVLSGFNWSRFDLVQFATSLMQKAHRWQHAGGHEPYTWVSSAYRCGDSPWLSISEIKSTQQYREQIKLAPTLSLDDNVIIAGYITKSLQMSEYINYPVYRPKFVTDNK